MSQVTSQRGRPFANGNPGRKPGSRNRASVVAAALVEGEAEELVRTALRLAKAGDVVMLKFLLGPDIAAGAANQISATYDGDCR